MGRALIIKANKFDNYDWVCKVINSCKTSDQLDNALNLITNFDKIYKHKALKMMLLHQINNKHLKPSKQ